MSTSSPFRLCFGVAAALVIAAAPASASVERTFERVFRVASGSAVTVDVSGASITTMTGPRGVVELKVTQIVDVDSEAEADRLLSTLHIAATQQGGEVRLDVKRDQDREGWRSSRWNRLRLRATLTVPADVKLDLNTSGGSITVQGERTAVLDADTSGGSITVEGGTAEMNLDTSGGSIKVGRALGALRANTSGGGITVDHVGRGAKDVSLDTSGGSIRVGVDTRAALDIEASTSGGTVNVEGLGFTSRLSSRSRSRVSGSINGGGGQLHAETSGGSIRIFAATSN